MADAKKIVSARIVPSNPNLMEPPYKAQVFVTLEGQEGEGELFSYYDDELTFTPDDFVGLKIDEGHDLFAKRDKAYLQS